MDCDDESGHCATCFTECLESSLNGTVCTASDVFELDPTDYECGADTLTDVGEDEREDVDVEWGLEE
jgi:hypothetical protein